MGSRRSSRRPPPPPPLSRYKSIPFRWLSCPNNGQAIHTDNKKNLFFIPMKTPLPEIFVNSLGVRSPWTAWKVIQKVKSLVPIENSNFLAINVAASHEVIFGNTWESVGAQYARIIVSKDYNPESLDDFCSTINAKLDEIKDETLVCMVYCGCGLNRVGFCISGYLARHCDIPLLDAIKRCEESSPRLLYRQKPLDTLSSIFGHPPIMHGASPDWVKLDDKAGPIGEIPLPLEKYNAIKKVSRKTANNEEKVEVFRILAKAVGDTNNNDRSSIAAGAFPKFSTTLWDSLSLNELRTKEHLMTFEPRGVKAFIVVLSPESVFVVDMHSNVSELKAKAKCLVPAVASCILVEEKKRGVFLMTDLLLLGVNNIASVPLKDRLSYLAHAFTKNIEPESNEQYALQFIYRPMTNLIHASKLRQDLSNLFAKCEGISFYDCNSRPGVSLFLPTMCSAVLQFDYNGNDKSILYARGETYELEPVGIYRSPNPKFNGLDGRTNRFEFDSDKHEWNPVAVGHNDPPSTIEEVTTMLSFLSTNIFLDDLFPQLDKITYSID